jgi:hypothetical protein
MIRIRELVAHRRSIGWRGGEKVDVELYTPRFPSCARVHRATDNGIMTSEPLETLKLGES